MSQHDMEISNADGATVRTDISAALKALASTSKGSVAPTTPYLGQTWCDDSVTPWAMKTYTGTTVGWVTSATINPTTGDVTTGAAVSGAGKVAYTDELSSNISVSGFLDRQGLWTEDEVGIQQAADYIAALEKNDRVQIAPRKTIVLSQGITLNASTTLLDGHGSVLDASALTSGAAINWSASIISQDYRGWRGIRDLRLEGPGYSSAVSGIKFQNTADAYAVAHLRNDGVVINSFGMGEYYADKAYLISSYDCTIQNCAVGMKIGTGIDCGENLRRYGGGINQCGTAIIMNNGSADLYLYGVSFDFNTVKVLDVSGGQVCMVGGHIESDDFSQTPITLAQYPDGVRLFGVSITTKQGPGYDYVVSAEKGATCLLDGCHLNVYGTRSGYFSIGDGNIDVRSPSMPEIHSNPGLLNATQALLADGGFEGASFLDLVWIYGDTTGIVDRYSGANIRAELSSDYARSGSQSLCLTKTFGWATAATFILAASAVRPGQRFAFKGYYREPGPDLGSMQINGWWARITSFDDNNIPVVSKSTSASASVCAFTAEEGGWTACGVGGAALAAPAWATHVIVGAELSSYYGSDGGPIWFDDVELSVWG